MNRLIKWFNLIIIKQKGLKRWQRVVTVLAAMITFATTYALILPAITVEKDSTGEVGGMYLEKTAKQDDLQEDNALEPVGVSIAADMDNAVTFAYADEDLTATAIFSTDEVIPEGSELVVNLVDPTSDEYAVLRERSEGLLDKEFIYDVTTCSFYDYALVCENVDVTPGTGLVDIQIIFRNNTVEHINDMVYTGRFARPAEEDGFAALTAVEEEAADELVSVNPDESSVIDLNDDIITSLSLKGNDLAWSDSIIGILAGNVDEEVKAAASETDAEIPDTDETLGEDNSNSQDENTSNDSEEDGTGTPADTDEITTALPVKTLKASGSDYTVTLTYDESSKIPEGASLAVSEISKDSKEYQTYLDETKKAMGLTEEETLPSFAARFFDIKIMVDGQEFTPDSGVSVEITYAEPLAEYSDTEVNAVHFADEKAEAEVIEANTTEVQENGEATVEFTAESFSVYGVIYTVDFHWEADGETYEFSLNGGGFFRLSEIVEALRLADAGEQGDSAEQFVSDVANVEFSAPEFVWVGKIDEESTVAQIKEANELECLYSTGLSEEDIDEINAQTVVAGDWVLISLQPFTSEETLTITMENGDQFVIKVTDAQKSDANMLEEGEQYVLYIVYYGNYYTLNSNGDTVRVPNNNLDNLGSEYLWTYDFKPKAEDPSLATDGCSWANGSNYLDVYWAFEDRWDSGKYNPVAPASGGWTPIAKLEQANDGGFYFRDVNDDDRYLYYDAGNTHIRTCHVSAHQQTYGSVPNPVSIHIYKQESTYTVSCKTDNAEYGNVRYTHGGNTQQTSAAAPSFNIVTVKNDSDNKQVPDSITAVPENGYKFTGWTVINESGNEYEVTDWGDGCTSESATIKPTVNGDLTLQANFEPERQYKITVQTNNIEMGTVGGGDSNGVEISNQESFESISTAVINDVGLNTYGFTATKKPLHTFVKWELRKANGDLVSEYTTPAIDAKSIQLTEDNMTLTAVFRKKTETEIDNDDINTLLDEWKSNLTGDLVGVDKTAHVHDYENRIYEIDLSASSGKWAVERSINLDFITDTSRSMYFPANLEYAISNLGSQEANRTASTTNNLKDWLTRNGGNGEYYVISNDDSATMYAVYKVGNEWKCKDSSYYYYIEAGTGTSNTEYDIQNNLTVGTRTATGVIYKSSSPTAPYTSHSKPSNLTEYWARLDYLYKAVMTATEVLKTIDPNSEVGLTTFNKQSDNKGLLGSTEAEIYEKLQEISPLGGTRQDRGLWTARTGTNIGRLNDYVYPDTTTGPGANSVFQYNSSNQQFAIIVTDGAPNGARWNDSGSIIDQANALKAITDSTGKNLTLMTLGIGSDFVGDNKGRFDSLASESKYAENANNGGEIVKAIKDLVQAMVKKADLYGTVSDTLDPAFYPVDENDDPITPGFYKDGEPYTPSAGDTSEYYEWSKDGEVWTITYYNQTFKWPEMDSAGNITKNGWEDSFYVKAKENFMGGNTIETNKTTDSDPGTTFTATHTIILDDNGTELPGSKREIKNKDNEPDPIVKNDIPTPHVNVKQLTLDSNDTRWTVYTETNVFPPITQIQELFNTINVQEVVDSSTDNMITGSTAMMFTPGSGTVPETFLLKDVINVTDEDWNDLMGLNGGDGTVDIPYTAYGHEPGVIRLTLTKEGEAADFSEHVTSSSPNAEEKYILTAQYVPYTVAEMQAKDSDHGNYHTTSGEEPGTVQQDGRKSVNTHIIDLFTRGISITKTDVTFTNGLPGAEFMVYRPATADEINSTDPDIIAKLKTFEGDSDTYFADHELDFDAHGVAYKNGVKAYGETTKYYLVETKAPDGYNLLEDPIPVELKITDSYTLMPVREGATPITQETKPASGLFNWEQKATLQLVGESGFIRTTAVYDPDDPSTDLTHTGINPTSLYEVMYYRIANTPGVELPYTGGPGTNLIYLIGITLIGLAGAGLVMKRRRRNTV